MRFQYIVIAIAKTQPTINGATAKAVYAYQGIWLTFEPNIAAVASSIIVLFPHFKLRGTQRPSTIT